MEPRELPKGWEWKPMGQACLLNPPRRSNGLSDESLVSFVPMAAVDEVRGQIARPQAKPLASVKKGYTCFEEEDILFAKITPSMENGKAAIARGLVNRVGFASTEFHVIRPLDGVIPEWLFYFIRQERFREEAAANFTGSVGQQRVPEFFLEKYPIPIPPIDEQRRIVACIEELLDRIDHARSLRLQARDQSRLLWVEGARKVFSQISKSSLQQLGNLVAVRGGSTPSKSNPAFWNGRIPWISPKDMKSRDLWDSEDHVSEEAVGGSAQNLIPVNSVLVVVRGLILTHTVPIAVLRVPATMNQDMKALVPNESLNAEYLCCALWALNDELLNLVDTSSHGTRKLDTSKLLAFAIPVPPPTEQDRIVAHLGRLQSEVRAIQRMEEETASEFDALTQAILAKAFRGELTR